MTDELSALMKQYRELLDEIKERKTLKEEVRTQILVNIKTNDITNFEDDNNKLEFTMNKRKSFNKEKAIDFIESKGEKADDYFTESDYEMLKVKAKNTQEVNQNE